MADLHARLPKPRGHVDSLIAEYVTAGTDHHHRRKLRKRSGGGTEGRQERISRVGFSGICLVESVHNLTVESVARSVGLPRLRAVAPRFYDRIEQDERAQRIGREPCVACRPSGNDGESRRQSEVAAGTVAAKRYAPDVEPIGPGIGQSEAYGLKRGIERVRKGIARRERIINSQHGHTRPARQLGTKPRATVDAAETPAAAMQIDQHRKPGTAG